ncbi:MULTISPECIES: flagellar motor protein MotB [unclassified Sphingomonas]|uniref:flagellar motor protein MotB n=1 Tax=unclassified Sphingomonas TaxID=196159 RepID=UPI0006F8C3FA|nr:MULTISPECIES: flagellar motor protein MotB [unclassified Sphingomonas]KQO08321.1 flagellar motor protein [Sphingomonas sp. Leaf242]KQS48333.1 flagellar motor protein [Sphingomonas sp. Leaf198]RMB34600.1 chemotaxis protein MotB [Sphingomonas sp. PP-F2F-G114-C0414]
MARAPHGNIQPPKIIVKKIYIEGHGGHHGGAWKVAYADFVTAMMAFFLLLWILGATTEKQRKGIADYFAPTLLDTRSLGIGGGALFGGESILDKNKIGPKAGQTSMPQIAVPDAGKGGASTGTGEQGTIKNRQALASEDRKNFEAMRKRVLSQIAASPKLSRLASHVRFVPTQDGMRIDLVDDADYSMFALGTTALDPQAGDLIGMIAKTIEGMKNPIMIRGHTDSVPYGDPRAMNNWMLSSGRAEATRRRLLIGGTPEARFERIEGVADREPLIVKDPSDPRNRRVAITLLYRRGVFGK